MPAPDLAGPRAVAAAVEAVGPHLPGQAPLGRFVHFIALQGDLHRPFDEAARRVAERRGASARPPTARWREHLAEGRLDLDDLRGALRERLGDRLDDTLLDDPVVSREAVWLHALRHDLGGLPPERLRDALGDGLRRPAPDLDPQAAAALLRGRRPADVLAPLWQAVLDGLGLTWGDRPDTPDLAVPSPPAATRARRHAWAREEARALGDGVGRHGVGGAWRALTGADVDGPVEAALVSLLSSFADDGLARWTPPERADGFAAFARRAIRAGATPALPPDTADLLDGLPADPSALAHAALVALGVPPERWEAVVAREVMALPGWSGMAWWHGARPDLPAQRVRPLDLHAVVGVRLALLLAVVRRVGRDALGVGPHLDDLARWVDAHPDEALVRRALHAGALPDDLAREVRGLLAARRGAPRDHAWSVLAHAWWRLREAQGADRERVGDTAWPVFLLAQHLGLDADALRTAGHRGARALADALAEASPEALRAVGLEAAEARQRDELLAAVADNLRAPAEGPDRPSAQVCTCLDDREEGLRRHVEEVDPTVDTYGIAGFFGVAVRYRGLGWTEALPLCPITVDPPFLVTEELRPGARVPPTGAVDRLLARVGFARPRPAPTHLAFQAAAPLRDRSPQRPQAGFTDDEQAERVAHALRLMGLGTLAPLVVLCGHGASSVNNPYAASYDCGACAGKHGGPNARLLAAMANRPAVRARLWSLGVEVPDDTWFVACEHDTTTDGLTWFDLDDLPPSHREAHARVRATLEEAARRSAHERCRRLPLAPRDPSPDAALRHVRRRALDPSEPRPELGHTGNAACVVGRRALTRGLFLDRRVFLASYDPTDDPDGALLEAALLAAGPVGAQIAFDYLLSTADRERLGAGSKAGQNVVGLLGVQLGAEGDLRTGLPWQMIEQHEPLRLLLVVEAPPARVLAVAARQPALRDLVEGAWVRLVVIDLDGRMHRYTPGEGFTPWAPPRRALPARARSADVYRGETGPVPPARIVGEVPRG